METQRRINEFNHENKPFYIVDHEDGLYSLCLPFTFFEDEYAEYCQTAFDNYARSIGDPVDTPLGLKTHGNGYEWEAAFRQTFISDPNIKRVHFDCEAGGFFCMCDDLDIIEDFGIRFKEVCEDTERFTNIIAEGIQKAEEWEKEQEQLMKTVRGHLMKHPNSIFEIKTPDGHIRLGPERINGLLSGEINQIQIDGCYYAAYELLDQEVTASQVDIFDGDTIRMVTSGEYVQGFEPTM